MIETTVTLSTGALVALFLELVKWLVRKFVVKDDTFDFPPAFYVIAVPVLNVLALPAMALLIPETYTMPTDWLAFARSVLLVALGSAATLVTYESGIKPLKEYIREYKTS